MTTHDYTPEAAAELALIPDIPRHRQHPNPPAQPTCSLPEYQYLDWFDKKIDRRLGTHKDLVHLYDTCMSCPALSWCQETFAEEEYGFFFGTTPKDRHRS